MKKLSIILGLMVAVFLTSCKKEELDLDGDGVPDEEQVIDTTDLVDANGEDISWVFPTLGDTVTLNSASMGDMVLYSDGTVDFGTFTNSQQLDVTDGQYKYLGDGLIEMKYMFRDRIGDPVKRPQCDTINVWYTDVTQGRVEVSWVKFVDGSYGKDGGGYTYFLQD